MKPDQKPQPKITEVTVRVYCDTVDSDGIRRMIYGQATMPVHCLTVPAVQHLAVEAASTEALAYFNTNIK